MQQYSEILQPL
jgi:hypothetical protein